MSARFNLVVRLEARAMARDLGYSRKEVRQMVAQLSDKVIAERREEFKLQVPLELEPGVEFAALGDGSLLKALFEWISSPEGQAFIKFLIGLFLAL